MIAWAKDYLGIPFVVHGRSRAGCDCWGLVCLVYEEQATIRLPAYSTDYTSGDIRGRARAINRAIHSNKDQCFNEVVRPVIADAVLMQFGELPLHVGVFIGQEGGKRYMIHTTELRGQSYVEDIDSVAYSGASPGSSDTERPELLTVDVCPAPFSKVRTQAVAIAGQSIEEILGLSTNPPDALAISVVMNGRPVDPALWIQTYPCVKDRVTVIVVPRDGPGGSNPAAVIALIALTVVAPYAGGAIASAIGVTGLTASLVSGGIAAGIVVGGASIINRFIAAPTPKDELTNRQVFGLSGIRNSLPARSQPVTSVFGAMRLFPFYATRPYIEVSGDDQFLNVLFDLGYGPLEITDADLLRLGDIPISEYDSVTTSFHGGTPGADSTLAGYDERHNQVEINLTLKKADSWREITTAPDTDRAVFTIAFPQGLVVLADSGPLATTVEFETQTWNGSVWVDSIDIMVSGDEAVLKLASRTFNFTSRGQHKVRIRRITDDPAEDDHRRRNLSVLSLVDSINTESPVTIQGRALLQLRIKATGQLNGVVDSFSLVVRRLLQTYVSGTGWTSAYTATSSPAWAMASILRGNSTHQPVADSEIDGPGFLAFANYCLIKEFHVQRCV